MFDEHERVGAFVADQLGGLFAEHGFGPFKAIGVEERGALIAGAVFHNWRPVWRRIEMTIAATSPRWAVPGVIDELVAYARDGCDCDVMLLEADVDNPLFCRILSLCGASIALIPHMHGLHRHRFMATLTADDWARSRLGERINGRSENSRSAAAA